MDTGGLTRLLPLLLILMQALGAVWGGAQGCAPGGAADDGCCCLEELPEPIDTCCGTPDPEPSPDPCECCFEPLPEEAPRSLERVVLPSTGLCLARPAIDRPVVLAVRAALVKRTRDARARPSPLLRSGRLRI